ncbi:aldo/keto reductase [Candidatus Enterococcus ferrettii]|uniref:NADP-dependent oxidoreductase domain-containing protein n=1 Tax=Candidatus Enterococcus ferrettii TaxID=2815324 RepID=A0ABV0ESQ0_9ENTE|nr:aldo/keto reductase [Enterococcus sp. 665A]MBO1343097.1 aldo/keto reductase [Enterococcus sp. 665A]
MKYCQIKGLDAKVARIALGTGWFGPDNEEVIFELLDAYVANGGNVIDTGRFYNGGKAEIVITKWLEKRGNRDQLLLVNKACHHYVDENNVQFPDESRVGADYITEDLEYSLKNMSVDHFDMYIMHRDNEEVPVEELMDCFEQHRLEGKIVTYGVSNWSVNRIKEADDYCKEKGYLGLSINSPSFTLADINKPRWYRSVYVDADYVKKNNEMGITVMSWGAQGAGFFVPLWKDMDADAPRDIKEAFFTENNFKKLARVKEVAKIRGVEPINIALAYVLNDRFDVFASIGPRNKKELLSSLKAQNVHLASEEIAYLELKSPTL